MRTRRGEPSTARARPQRLWAIVGVVVALAGQWPSVAASPVLAPRAATPPPAACAPNPSPTPSQTEGPFYKPNTPERVSLREPGMAGTSLTVTGYVLSTDCTPVPQAWLDFWQANDRGEYDNAGYRLRGHQFADGAGAYRLETIVPGLYPGRTRHIHVKVRAPKGPVLTTQLYFPQEARNQTDGIFIPALVLALQDAAAGKVATFNFLVRAR